MLTNPLLPTRAPSVYYFRPQIHTSNPPVTRRVFLFTAYPKSPRGFDVVADLMLSARVRRIARS